MARTSLHLLTYILFSSNALAMWEFYAYHGLPGMLSYARLDPIISPGKVSQHVHQIQGGNAFQANYDYATLRSQSTCTTIEVQEDLSNYWAPALYSYSGGQFSLMLARFQIYYLDYTLSYDANNADGMDKRYPFPEGLQLVGGDLNQRQVNYSDANSQASIFQCQRSGASDGGPYSHDMRDFQRDGLGCDNALRATTQLPSCWNGKGGDRSNVAYPEWNNICPPDYPYAMMRILLEWYFPVQDFPLDPEREDNWVFSSGDASGYGFHGDFSNGWNTTLLAEAIDGCTEEETGIEKCSPFGQWNYTEAKIPPCMPTGLYPDENVGLDGQNLTSLPGCNLIWNDNSTKPRCNGAVATPPITKQLGLDLTNWNYVSCPFVYNDQGFILTDHFRTGWLNMTLDACLAECAGGGYKYALVEWGQFCLCDNEIRNNVSIASSKDYPCQVRCPADYLENCGGYGSGGLYEYKLNTSADLV